MRKKHSNPLPPVNVTRPPPPPAPPPPRKLRRDGIQVTITEHICGLTHCERCGDCINPPRILCDVCRQVAFENKRGCNCHYHVGLAPLPEGIKVACPIHDKLIGG